MNDNCTLRPMGRFIHKALTLSFCFICMVLTNQTTAQNLLSRAVNVESADNKALLPTHVQFEAQNAPTYDNQATFIHSLMGLSTTATAQLVRKETDDFGFTHFRYQQTLRKTPIEGAEYLYHVKDGKLLVANGFWLTDDALQAIDAKTADKVGEKMALKIALKSIKALKYKWDLADEETHLKAETGDNTATYFPKGEKVFVKFTEDWNTEGVRLAWKFNVYAHEPLSRRLIYIDAETGQVLTENDELHQADVVGTANTAYSGVKPMTSDNYATGAYRLRETGRGLGIRTYNMKKGTNYASAVDFTNTSTTWNTTGTDRYALDAHFGAEQTYDYYKNVHNRNSIDNQGFAILSYVHYSSNYVNAFWDGSRMTYGDGNTTVTPLTAMDVCGHEITHGLTTKTANLTYSREPGAMNEGFSDIFGTVIEFYSQPTTYTPNWTIGERMNLTIRNMADPNQFQDPDTYKGTYWQTSSGDSYGVHTNSGVLNFWFYLLSVGKSGTNDKGTPYNVVGIGIDKAAKIAFRTLTVYLTASSQYANARTSAIQAATDLYGAASNEVKQTTNAWCAVGVGTVCTSTPFAGDNNTEASLISNSGGSRAGFANQFYANVSPNPSKSLVNVVVSADSEGEANILVLNTIGKAVWSNNTYLAKGQNSQTLDVSQWAKGLYLIRIKQGTNTVTEKLIVD